MTLTVLVITHLLVMVVVVIVEEDGAIGMVQVIVIQRIPTAHAIIQDLASLLQFQSMFQSGENLFLNMSSQKKEKNVILPI